MGVERGLHIGGEDRAAGRHRRGHRGEPVGRRDEAVLMGMQAEDGLAEPVGGARLHHADGAVAVLHGEGEIACLERGAHAAVFAFGHAALADEPLGSATDAAPERADEAAARGERRQGFSVQGAFTRRNIPKRRRLDACTGRKCRL